jgi:hypothetical protein
MAWLNCCAQGGETVQSSPHESAVNADPGTTPEIVFLCGARDFHAMDWFRSAQQTLPNDRLCVLTDLIAGEGFHDLRRPGDRVFKLFLLDPLLLHTPSTLANLWRNVLKLLVFPLQVWRLRRFDRRHRGARYFCHSMYYLFLAWAAGVCFVGTPQGSDVLIKPYRSRAYRYFAVRSLRAARYVTVDSRSMRDRVRELAGVEAQVIQNGIDVRSILAAAQRSSRTDMSERRYILSIRGFTPLYRIDAIIAARNNSARTAEVPLALRYPFYEDDYRTETLSLLRTGDLDVGRVEVDEIPRLFGESRLVVSVPVSDSSPKSVYEAIFYGCAVAVTNNPYVADLPACMRTRLIIVDLAKPHWLDDALERAATIQREPYQPSPEAVSTFDKVESFKKVSNLLLA